MSSHEGSSLQDTAQHRMDRSGEPLYQQVVTHISESIANHQFTLHEKLPTEAKLARKLGLNRLTVSRGYDTLKERGVIVQKRGSGTFVSGKAHHILGIPHRRRLRNVAMISGAWDMSEVPERQRFIFDEIVMGTSDVFTPIHTNLCHFPVDLEVQHIDRTTRDRLASFDGAICVGNTVVPSQVVWELVRLGVPCVAALMPLSGSRAGIPSVTYDRQLAVERVVDHLVECGCRRIGFLGNFPRGMKNSDKLVGFFSGLCKHGLVLDTHCCVDVTDTIGEAQQAVQKIVAGGHVPDAFFANTDYIAMEAIRALESHGLSVPNDVGVVGYNDVTEAATFEPALTTIRLPGEEVGQALAEMLANWPQNGEMPEDIIVKPELKIRCSTRSLTGSDKT